MSPLTHSALWQLILRVLSIPAGFWPGNVNIILEETLLYVLSGQIGIEKSLVGIWWYLLSFNLLSFYLWLISINVLLVHHVSPRYSAFFHINSLDKWGNGRNLVSCDFSSVAPESLDVMNVMNLRTFSVAHLPSVKHFQLFLSPHPLSSH